MKKTIVLTLALLSALFSFSQNGLTNKHFNTEKGLAVAGYDVVAYFNQAKPLKGDARFKVIHRGIAYHFVSEANKSAFLKDPDHYEPQYGGWCAYAMGATGEKVEVDPETYKILNGKLYLFYHSWVNNTLTKWNKDEVNLKKQADKNWQKTYQ